MEKIPVKIYPCHASLASHPYHRICILGSFALNSLSVNIIRDIVDIYVTLSQTFKLMTIRPNYYQNVLETLKTMKNHILVLFFSNI